MAGKTIADVIEMAIQREQDAFFFYTDILEKTDDPALRETLEWMAKEEKKHRRFLVDYRNGSFASGTLSMRQSINYKIAEHMAPPEPGPEMKREEVFLVASHRELNAHQFYSELAGLHPAGEVRDVLLKMAQEELKHKEKMEYLYSNASFPQTDGG
jgi:rubrerythrin